MSVLNENFQSLLPVWQVTSFELELRVVQQKMALLVAQNQFNSFEFHCLAIMKDVLSTCIRLGPLLETPFRRAELRRMYDIFSAVKEVFLS